MRGTTTRLAAALIPVLLTGLAGCGHQKADAGSPQPLPVPDVRTAQPVRQTLPRLVEQPGRIEAFEQTPLFAKIPGFVKEVRVEIGARVKQGEVLAELDVPEMVEELKHKQGLVTQARLEIRQAETALAAAEAAVKTAYSLAREAQAGKKRADASVQRWKSESARMEVLVKERVIDAQSRDEARSQLRASEASLEEAEARTQSAEAGKVEAEAKRDKAEADLAAAKNRLVLAETEERRMQALLGYAHVTAPFDGVVSDRRVHTGHFLQPASGGTKGEPLFVVVRMDKVRVFVEVPEADATLVRQGTPGRIRVQALNDREFTGTVAGTSWSLEPGQRTLRTEIDFANPDGILRPGMYAHTFIEAERPDAWTLPSAAILIRDGQTFCYRVEGGKAVRTLLRVGSRHGEAVEVLKKQRRPGRPGESARWEDLTGQEQVIVSGAGELAEGQAVNVVPER